MATKIKAITMSADEGCGGAEVAQEVARQLHFRCLDEQTLSEVIADINLPPKIGKPLIPDIPLSRILVPDRDAYGLIEPDYLRTIVSTKPKETNPPDYQTLVSFLIKILMEEGKVILLVPEANFILSGRKDVLNVRLEASPEAQTERLSFGKGLEAVQVRDYLAEATAQRAAYMQKYYPADWTNPLYYHLTINTAEVPVWVAAKIIGQFCHMMEQTDQHVDPLNLHRSYTKLNAKSTYTVNEAAELLLIDPDQIRQAVYQGELSGIVVEHNVLRVSREALLEWLRSPLKL
jgi:excisionase family DNA binding protein